MNICCQRCRGSAIENFDLSEFICICGWRISHRALYERHLIKVLSLPPEKHRATTAAEVRLKQEMMEVQLGWRWPIYPAPEEIRAPDATWTCPDCLEVGKHGVNCGAAKAC